MPCSQNRCQLASSFPGQIGKEQAVVGLGRSVVSPAHRRSSAHDAAGTAPHFAGSLSWSRLPVRRWPTRTRQSGAPPTPPATPPAGVAEHTTMSALTVQPLQALTHAGEGGHAAHHVGNRPIDRHRPGQGLHQLRIVRLGHSRFQGRIPQLVLCLDPGPQPLGNRNVHAPGGHFRPFLQPLERLDQRRKTVHTAALGVQDSRTPRLRARTC